MTLAPEANRPTSANPCELTILMPCLNEAETIPICVEKARSFLARSRVAGEVLIADNSSTDGSAALAEQGGARVIAVAERGYGAALMAGIVAARGRFVIMGDADDSYDFAHLDSFVTKLRNGCDLVIGNRFAGGIAPGAMPFLHRHLGNRLLSFIGRLLFHAAVSDFHCGLRGFRRDAVLALNLRTSGMEFASEMVVRASSPKCRRRLRSTGARDRRICVPGMTAGHICAFSSCSVHAGCSFIRVLPSSYSVHLGPRHCFLVPSC
jgi:glycosyltransferase involved in cell wall biosynthesis